MAQDLMENLVQDFAETIRGAGERGAPLRLRGGGSKDFYGGAPAGEILDTREYQGVIDHEPTELVITARAGTPLAELESVLAASGQMLAFEPPHFGAATLGGCIAAGLSGPRRAAAGAVRDFVLGVRVLDGRGRDLRFGGQVMKNVAGYDVSRLVTGAMGTLGLILEVSLKVLPLPPAQITLRFEMPEDAALRTMNQWSGQPLPVTATCFAGSELTVRLAGAEAAVLAAHRHLGGDVLAADTGFWSALREHSADFFAGGSFDDTPLWRLSVPSNTPPLELPGALLVEWGGALRWQRSGAPARRIREAAAKAGGHATLFRAADKSAGVFHPLAGPLLEIHRKLKLAFDPHGIFNPGRMYAEI
jgi:glycolate oxidase FAD binding subunit